MDPASNVRSKDQSSDEAEFRGQRMECYRIAEKSWERSSTDELV